MRTIFLDFENPDNPANGSAVTTAAEVEALFDELRQQYPFVCELQCENETRLTIGLSAEVGCVQYSGSDGMPPYLVAVGDGSFSENKVFYCGGQETEIEAHHCLPYELVKSIAMHFVETGEKSELVQWTPA